MNQDLQNIIESNEEMLTYFNRLYSDHEAELKEHKARLFEINVKLDELNRTKTVYALNTDYRRNVFSLVNSHTAENEKEDELRAEIQELVKNQRYHEDRIDEESSYLKSIDKKIKKLDVAKQSMQSLLEENEKFAEERKQAQKKTKEIEEKSKQEQKALYDELSQERIKNREQFQKHLRNIMMLNAFDSTVIGTVLDKRIKDEINKNSKKLESIRNILYSDPVRSKITLDEVMLSQKNIQLVINNQLEKLNYGFDDKRLLGNMLHDYVSDASEKHPEIAIDFDIDTFKSRPDFVRYTYLKNLLDIFFSNIYKHSKANHVEFTAKEIDGTVEISIVDNGTGIPEDYLSRGQWYSGLHRAEELIFLMSGKLSIRRERGTIVKFAIKF